MNPFSYGQPRGVLAGLTATSKTVALALLSVAALRISPPAAALLALAGFAGTGFSAASLRGARGVLLLALGAALARGLLPNLGADQIAAAGSGVTVSAAAAFRLFDPGTLPDSLAYAARLLAVYFLGCTYYASTLPSDLGDAATLLARRAHRFVAGTMKLLPGAARRARHAGSAPDPGMYLGLTLAFLPRAFDRYRRTREAAALRAYGMTDRRPGPLVAVLSRFAYSSVRDALLTSRAMELRCYDPERTIAPAAWRVRDCAAVALAGAIAAATLSTGVWK